MAQAARLNLRMQKELKLLLSDPPPGSSFPFLSADSDLTSLSTIHAHIEGPQGTVYAKGVFEIKIQIPERYPFQPPSVTFATPIYHPNIDNGGRICLDILSLPPKGAWQPSLNISTVLTSIGLLLSEPNPDDGLMCEASREYKYNRQAFDQKARSMTEKYAKAGAAGNNFSTQGVPNLNSTVAEVRGSIESRLEVSELVSSHNNQYGISRKLSLEFSSSSQNRDNDVEVNEMGANGKRKDISFTLDDCNLRREKLCGTRRKLSLESSCQILKQDGCVMENVLPNQFPLCSPETISVTSSGSSLLHASNFRQQKHHNRELKNGSINTSSKHLCEVDQEKPCRSLDKFQPNDDNNEKIFIQPEVLPSQSRPKSSCGAQSMPLSINCNELEPCKDFINTMGNGSTEVNYKKISSFGKKHSLGFKGLSLGQEKDNKENVAPLRKQPLSSPHRSSTKIGIGRKLSLGPLTHLQDSNNNNSCILSHKENLSTDASKSLFLRKENKEQTDQDRGETQQQKTVESPISEVVVVLDSEDSEEERDGVLRSKLLLGRKRMGKYKIRA
ncbi:hypothetical protein Pint_13165 [Pistacia integerrima]|uniref:Uncharacterized protein n=1 Tax=Pistacia integerrima TaxID=434235 RepID=A0ACC0Y510_9ROSI|nr:hypothetical protein Pint_13165 [Pistacia integerrima]